MTTTSPTTQTAIQLHAGNLVQRMDAWVNLADEERRRRAVMAARDRDLEALWSLTEAYITLAGGQGAATSQNTLKSYKVGIRQYVEGTQHASLLDPRAHTAMAWKQSLVARFSPATVNARLAAARALYAALRWAQATEKDPFRDVKVQRNNEAKEHKTKIYSRQEIRDMYLLADPRERVILLLGGHAGLRVSEACAVNRAAIGQQLLQVIHGKGGKNRKVHMSTLLQQAIDALPPPTRKRNIKPQTLINIGDDHARVLIKALAERAGVVYQGIHALRRAAGTRMYEATKDLLIVADHLGHSDVKTAAIYVKLAKLKTSVVTDWGLE